MFTSHSNISTKDQKDILELKNKIDRFKKGEIDEERFKLYRLTRGVYGQRQLGVQMFRIKIPYGKISPKQIQVIADLADEYGSSNLHLTTRQDIQLHYVKLESSPDVWLGLTNNGLTGREACGNTVRNLTASPTAGIDPDEPFDVTPYAHAVAYYFLRNPICQEMGRKIKPCFSSSDLDTAFTYFHDFGFIPVIQDGERGFKVYVGGGLGAVAITAQKAYDFLPENQIIPFMEASLRIFDRHGERSSRNKARMKFLLKKIGLDKFLELVKEERKALTNQTFSIDTSDFKQEENVPYFEPQIKSATNQPKYNAWLKTNTFSQKQENFRGVYIKVFLGDISSDKALLLSIILEKYASQDVRITLNQGLLLRFIHADHLAELFTALDEIGYAEPGFDSIADITACPGTDTCNLGVTNSTGLAGKLEEMLRDEYPDLIEEHHLKIKISGCMNACGQHMIGNIGFSGSSIKKNNLVIPAMQVVLGGGTDPSGKGWIGEKVIKLPTKRLLEAVRVILNDFEEHKIENEYYNFYYQRQGKKHFYNLLKPLADIDSLQGPDLFDWGQDHHYKQEIGVGECAGVILDVVGAIFLDAQEKLKNAKEELAEDRHAESIYYSYSSMVIACKGLLLSEDVKCNTQITIIKDFQSHFVDSKKLSFQENIEELILQINKNEPSEEFAKSYLLDAETLITNIIQFRNSQLQNGADDNPVIKSYYKA